MKKLREYLNEGLISKQFNQDEIKRVTGARRVK